MPNLKMKFNGGVNLFTDQRDIGDNQLVKAQNVCPTLQGILRTRLPRDTDGDAILSHVTYPLAYQTFALGSDSTDIIATKSRVSMARDPTSGLEDQAIYDPVDGSDCAPRRPFLLAWNDSMYCLQGGTIGPSGKVLSLIGTVPGTRWHDLVFQGAQSISPRPATAVVYRRRFVYGNLAPGFEDCILFADADDPTLIGNNALALNGRYIRLPSVRKDRVVALVEILPTQTGSPADTALLVLMEYSAFLITGETSLTTSSDPVIGTLNVNRMAIDCGCSSPETVVRTPYGFLWASWDDVWLFNNGQLPERVGSNIRPALARTPAVQRYTWHAAYFAGFYRLAVYSDGQDPGVNEGNCEDQWWLDLRKDISDENGPQWWGPMQYTNEDGGVGTWNLWVDALRGDQPQLRGVGALIPNLLTFRYTYDTPSAGMDHEGSAAGAVPLAGLTAIIPDLLAKEVDFEDPMVDKLYQGMEVNVWASRAHQLTVACITDGGVATDSDNVEMAPKGFVMDVDALDSALLTREYQSLKSYPSTTRPRGKTLQFEITAAAGIYIGEDNDTFEFGTGLVATLTHGLYANLKLFLDMLCARILVAGGPVVTHNQTVANNTAVVLTAGATMAIHFVGASLRETRMVGAIMGFDTSSDLAGTVFTAANPVQWARMAALEFGGFTAKIRPLGRRPL